MQRYEPLQEKQGRFKALLYAGRASGGVNSSVLCTSGTHQQSLPTLQLMWEILGFQDTLTILFLQCYITQHQTIGSSDPVSSAVTDWLHPSRVPGGERSVRRCHLRCFSWRCLWWTWSSSAYKVFLGLPDKALQEKEAAATGVSPPAYVRMLVLQFFNYDPCQFICCFSHYFL